MAGETIDPWKMETVPVSMKNPPSWAAHLANPQQRSYASVKEIGIASGEEYPHFAAVLTPERTFLHYLISEMICTVSIPDKEFLAAQVKRLYDQNKGMARMRYETNRRKFLDQHEIYRALANSYYEEHKDQDTNFNPEKYTREIREIELQNRGVFDWLANPNKLHKEINGADSPHGYYARKIRERLDSVFEHIEKSMNDRALDYIPGSIDTEGVNDFKKVFIATFVDYVEQKQIESIAKQAAQKVIGDELARTGPKKQLHPLPMRNDRTACKHTVITGVMASGKTTLLQQLEREGKIDRTQCAMIDIDEFRDLEKILTPTEDIKPGQEKSWANKSHEECHMIRRKILDRLDEMGNPPEPENESEKTKPLFPNVVLMTSFLSPRLRSWITEHNPEVNMYALYCDPDEALRRARDRAQKDQRWLSTERVLDSVKDLATTVRYLFGVETGKHNKLTLRVVDTSKSVPGTPILTEETLVLKAETGKVDVINPDTLMAIHRGFYINTGAKSPTDPKLYKDAKDDTIYTRMHASLRPHYVEFRDVNYKRSNCFVSKAPYAKELHSSTGISSMIGAVVGGWRALKLLFTHPELNGGTGKAGLGN